MDWSPFGQFFWSGLFVGNFLWNSPLVHLGQFLRNGSPFGQFLWSCPPLGTHC